MLDVTKDLKIERIQKLMKDLGVAKELDLESLQIRYDILMSKLYEECQHENFPKIAIYRIEQMLVYDYVLSEYDKELMLNPISTTTKSITVENVRTDLAVDDTRGQLMKRILALFNDEFLSFIHRYRTALL